MTTLMETISLNRIAVRPCERSRGMRSRPTARRRATVLSLLLAIVVGLGLGTSSAMAAQWSVIPKGKWSCSSTGNGCLAATGFNPSENYRDDWYQTTNPRGNCTKYAAFRLRKNGAPNFLRGGNAVTWARHARTAGKGVNRTPAVGAVAWWDGRGAYGAGGAGHVAYVEKISMGTVYLSDSSWNRGSSRWTVSKGSGNWPDAFLHIEDKPKPQPAPKPAPAPPAPAPPAPAPKPTPKPEPANRMSNDQRLLASKSQSLRSSDGRYRFVMQSDSSLVLYGPSGRALWASNTVGRGAHHLRMQGDGNLVIYNAANKPIWTSGTPRRYDAHLIVQNDGNVVIYNKGNPVWATGTDGRK